MIREVDLLSYLPTFLKDVMQLAEILKSENPEFKLNWESAEKVLNNEFIETSDESGISRFEKLLNIFPTTDDTLESRKSRVLFEWNNKALHTMRYLHEKLRGLCGDDYDVQLEDYFLKIHTHLFKYGEFESLLKLMRDVVSCELQWEILNDKEHNVDGNMYCGMVISTQYKSTTIYPGVAPQQQDIQNKMYCGQQSAVNVSYTIEPSIVDEEMKGM